MNRRQRITVTLIGALFIALLPPMLSAEDSPSGDKLVSQIEASIGRSPFDFRLRIQLGIAYMDKDDLAHALQAFQEAVQPAPTSAEPHNWLGVALMGKGDLPDAIPELHNALVRHRTVALGSTYLG